MSRLAAFLLLAALLLSVAPPVPAGQFQEPIDPFAGRRGATRAKLVKDGGGTDESEAAVARGLDWLAKQQKKDGSWEFDGSAKKETAAATGLAVLAFLGAGEVHKGKGKYQKNVQAGLNFLVKSCPVGGANAGKFPNTDTLYGQGIATLALAEAYGLTKDKPLLFAPAQAAVNFVQKSQGADGSWGYKPGTNGDTSILGWQVQALVAAKATRDIKVDDDVLKKAVAFLDKVATGEKKARYGYKDKSGAEGTALTAVGLWCRQRLDGWDAKHPGLAEGVAGLLKRGPAPGGRQPDAYFVHYAAQVVRDFGGDEWVTWNEGPKAADGTRKGGLRDTLVKLQITKEGAALGSWNPDGSFVGQYCGRLGTTALNVIALEVYYRTLPQKADAKDDKDDAPKKP